MGLSTAVGGRYHFAVPEIDDRSTAAALYNRCWQLLESDARTADDDVELLTSAFTSRHHWLAVGQRDQWITADWMVARAAAATGAGDLSLTFARRAYAAAREPGVPDWLVASAAEGVARAFAAVGDATQRDEWCRTAQALVAQIADPEDRSIIAEQLADVLR